MNVDDGDWRMAGHRFAAENWGRLTGYIFMNGME
jgi:hypothetical protein